MNDRDRDHVDKLHEAVLWFLGDDEGSTDVPQWSFECGVLGTLDWLLGANSPYAAQIEELLEKREQAREEEEKVMYCNWCGNVEVKLDKPVCEKCNKTLMGPLLNAIEAFQLINSLHGACCSGIKTDHGHLERKAEIVDPSVVLSDEIRSLICDPEITEHIDTSHLYLHPKDGESSNDTVTVECGVSFYPGYARCYWIFDSDQAAHCEGREYGPEISYQIGAENFVKVVQAVLAQAANAASECGIMSCEHCGDHYHESESCDCQNEDVSSLDSVAKTLRELVDYADAADPQLIDSLRELADMCESNASLPLMPISIIQEKIRTLASQVQPQDAEMADDLRHAIDQLKD